MSTAKAETFSSASLEGFGIRIVSMHVRALCLLFAYFGSLPNLASGENKIPEILVKVSTSSNATSLVSSDFIVNNQSTAHLVCSYGDLCGRYIIECNVLTNLECSVDFQLNYIPGSAMNISFIENGTFYKYVYYDEENNLEIPRGPFDDTVQQHISYYCVSGDNNKVTWVLRQYCPRRQCHSGLTLSLSWADVQCDGFRWFGDYQCTSSCVPATDYAQVLCGYESIYGDNFRYLPARYEACVATVGPSIGNYSLVGMNWCDDFMYCGGSNVTQCYEGFCNQIKPKIKSLNVTAQFSNGPLTVTCFYGVPCFEYTIDCTALAIGQTCGVEFVVNDYEPNSFVLPTFAPNSTIFGYIVQNVITGSTSSGGYFNDYDTVKHYGYMCGDTRQKYSFKLVQVCQKVVCTSQLTLSAAWMFPEVDYCQVSYQRRENVCNSDCSERTPTGLCFASYFVDDIVSTTVPASYEACEALQGPYYSNASAIVEYNNCQEYDFCSLNQQDVCYDGICQDLCDGVNCGNGYCDYHNKNNEPFCVCNGHNYGFFCQYKPFNVVAYYLVCDLPLVLLFVSMYFYMKGAKYRTPPQAVKRLIFLSLKKLGSKACAVAGFFSFIFQISSASLHDQGPYQQFAQKMFVFAVVGVIIESVSIFFVLELLITSSRQYKADAVVPVLVDAENGDRAVEMNKAAFDFTLLKSYMNIYLVCSFIGSICTFATVILIFEYEQNYASSTGAVDDDIVNIMDPLSTVTFDSTQALLLESLSAAIALITTPGMLTSFGGFEAANFPFFVFLAQGAISILTIVYAMVFITA